MVGILTVIFAIPAVIFTRENTNSTGNRNEGATNKLPDESITKYPALWVLIISLVAYTWVTQSVTVDMSIYSNYLNYSYSQTGTMMLLISVVTVISAISGGFVSDRFAEKAKNRVKARSNVLVIGYGITIIASFLLPLVASRNYVSFVICAVLMMFGVAWAQGVFWSIPPEMFSGKNLVKATSLCSGTSNIVNPIAPMVVGVLLGANGLWHLSWISCGVVCLISLLAAVSLARIEHSKYI